MRFAQATEQMTVAQRQLFYEQLAHDLTVAIRGVWSEPDTADAEKVERMKWINEVLHRVTAKVSVLRLRTHEWTEADFESLLTGYAEAHPKTSADLAWAVTHSYRAVTGRATDVDIGPVRPDTEPGSPV